jgi:hypothetical protein
MRPAEQGSARINVDDDFDLLSEQISALKVLAASDELSDGRIYDFSIRWGTALAGRLPRLTHYSSLGLLDGVNEHRFQVLCAELRELSGLIDRLGLVQPIFTAPPVATSKHHRPPGLITRRRRGRQNHRRQ